MTAVPPTIPPTRNVKNVVPGGLQMQAHAVYTPQSFLRHLPPFSVRFWAEHASATSQQGWFGVAPHLQQWQQKFPTDVDLFSRGGGGL